MSRCLDPDVEEARWNCRAPQMRRGLQRATGHAERDGIRAHTV